MANLNNTSLAYDLSVYEPEPVQQQAAAEKLQVVKAPRQFISSVITPRNFLIFAMAVFAVCFMVYYRAQLNEVTNEINIVTQRLDVLKNENVRMQSEIKSIISPRSVAEQAEHELGLKRIDKYQTEYIYLNHEDKVELADESARTSFFWNLRIKFNSTVKLLKEYISLR